MAARSATAGINVTISNENENTNTNEDETETENENNMDTTKAPLDPLRIKPGLKMSVNSDTINTLTAQLTIPLEQLEQLKKIYIDKKEQIDEIKKSVEADRKILMDAATQMSESKTDSEIANLSDALQLAMNDIVARFAATTKFLTEMGNQTEEMGEENIDLFLQALEGQDEATQILALENEEIAIPAFEPPTFETYKALLKQIEEQNKKELERSADIFESSIPPQERKKIGMNPDPDDDPDDGGGGGGDPKKDDDNKEKPPYRLRIRPPGRYGVASPMDPLDTDIPQLSYGAHHAILPTFIPLNIEPEALIMLTDEVSKLEVCPIDPQDCLFDHSVSTPFASTGTNYSKLECIPFCNQHLLSVFGIGLEYGKQITMDRFCQRKNMTFGPFAVAKSYNRKHGYAFRKYECIYPGINEKTIALGGALSALFSRREDLPSMHFTKNILNTFYYVLDSSDITLKDVCKPYDLLKKGNCDAGVFDVLATMIAFLIWSNQLAEVHPLSLAPYVNNLEFILTVAKKIIQLNRMTRICYEKTGQTPMSIFRLKLFDYETENHGLPPLHPTTVRRKTGIVATRDICQDERLSCKFDPDVLDDVYFKYKNHYEHVKSLKDRTDKFVKPPINAMSVSERSEIKSGFRISKHTLSDVADNCLGEYGNMGKLTSRPMQPLPPIVLEKPSLLPKRKITTKDSTEIKNKKIKLYQAEFLNDLVDRTAKNKASSVFRDTLARSSRDVKTSRDLDKLISMTKMLNTKTALENLKNRADQTSMMFDQLIRNKAFSIGGNTTDVTISILGNRRPNDDAQPGPSGTAVTAGAAGPQGPLAAASVPPDTLPGGGLTLGGDAESSNLIPPQPSENPPLQNPEGGAPPS